MSVLLTPNKEKTKIPKLEQKLYNLELPAIPSKIKSSKISPMINNTPSKRKKRNSNVSKDSNLAIDEKEIKEKYNEICNLYKTPYDLCVKCLEYFPDYRNNNIIKLISSYLRELIGLVDIISRVKNNDQFENAFNDIAEKLKYKYLPENRFVCRYGDKGTHFSILLKGKIVFLVPKLIKCYLNKTEYLEYLLKLKRYGEHELLKKMIIINRQYFDLGEDFEIYLKELLNSYKKINNNSRHNHNPFLTNELYKSIKMVVNETKKKSIKLSLKETDDILSIHPDFNDYITPEKYIERIKIPDYNLDPKDRKKVSIFYYQSANFYEGGQIYGTVALENKNNKISSTAITAEECYIGTLTKEEYQTKLLTVHIKSRELLYNLISSYDILGYAPKKAFDNRFCHMFKCIRFKRGTNILEEKKKLNSVYIFYAGKFDINLNSNIIELYDLEAKLKIIRAKMIGIKENEMKKELSDIYFKKEVYSNYKYASPEKVKFYLKKYNLTISLINDKICIGLADTLDPETHLGLFNCTCISANCDGYDITYDSLTLVNKEYPCLNNCNKITLTNLEYYLKRVQLHIKEIEIKIKKYEENLKYNNQPKNIKLNIKNNTDEKQDNEEDEESDDNLEIRRNTFNKVKKVINNEINLVQNIGNSFRNDYNSLMKKKLNKIGKKLTLDSNNNIYNNQRYESIKTTNNEIQERKNKKSSFISRMRKSINQKKYLLHLAQCKSNKYLKIQKEEIRSLIMAKNKKEENNSYIDMSAIFKRKNKNKNSEGSDLILDNIISSINKRVKRERILSSYLINDDNKENNKTKELSNRKEDKDIQTEEVNKKIYINNYNDNKEKDLFLIHSRFNNNDNKNTRNKVHTDLIPNTNIITLDGYISLADESRNEEKIINNNKKYNQQLNMNKLKKFWKINFNEDKKSNQEKGIKKVNSNKALKEIYDSNKDKVHLIDPLLFDKYKVKFNNKKFNTLEN